MALTYGVPSNGEVVGWNIVNGEYRYVDENNIKYAHRYAMFDLPNAGRNSIYFDDNGNARPLTIEKVFITEKIGGFDTDSNI